MSFTTLIRRTGQFAEKDPARCKHYAGWIEHIGRREADLIFWCLFGTVILLLVIASSAFNRASQTLLSTPEADLEKSRRYSISIGGSTNHRRVRVICLIISLFCFLAAVPCVVVEALAAFHVQFCDGEDLMMLYWGFWTLIQVGSMIAILGIALNQAYGLNNHTQPPWGVALGTPVLVIAAFAHYIKSVYQKGHNDRKEARSIRNSPSVSRASSIRGRDVKPNGSISIAQPQLEASMSRTSTMVSLAPAGSRFVGYSIENEPLYAFPADISQWSSEPASRRISTIDPILAVPSTAITPKKSRSPERDEKEVTFAETTNPIIRNKSAF